MQIENTKKASNRESTAEKHRILHNHYLYALALALITVFIFRSFIFSGKMLSSSDQIAGIDSRIVLTEALTRWGQFPTWFSSRLGGMPSIDAMFGEAMYIPVIILQAIMPVHKAMGYSMLLHVFLAGIFFYLLMVRGFRAHPFAAFVSAAFYMLNPEFISHVYPGHAGKMMVIAWLPFVVWRVKSLLSVPSLLNLSLMTAGISACLYTSHTQMTYFMLWGLLLYWVLAVILDLRKKSQVSRLAIKGLYFWIAVFAAVGMAFVQFFPSYMFIKDAFSVRGVEKGFEYAASWSLHWPEFFSLWVPEFGNYLQNYWGDNPFKLNTEYAGAMVTLFSVFAVIYKPSPWRIFWAVLGILAVFYSMGAHSPVFHAAYYLVPGVKKFRACSMIMFWFSFSTALLSGLFLKDVFKGGLSRLSDSVRKKWLKGLIIAMVVLTAVSLLFSLRGFVSSIMQDSLADARKSGVFERNFQGEFLPALWLWWFIALIAIGSLWALISHKLSPVGFGVIILIAGLFDVIRTDRIFIQVESPRRYITEDRALTELKSKMASAPFRCFFLPGAFSQNSEGIYGLEGIGDFHDNELRWYRNFRGDQQNNNYFQNIVKHDASGGAYLDVAALSTGNNFLNLANTKYYVTRQGGRVVTVENTSALPRISFASGYVVLEEQKLPQAIAYGQYDIRSTVALIEEPSWKPDVVMQDTSVKNIDIGTIWKKYSPNIRIAEIDAPSDGFLRISEVYYPGWKISVDGIKTRVYRSDLAWMAVAVKKGRHVVEMRPESLYLKKASFVSFPLMAILFFYWLFLVAKKFIKKPRKSA